MSQFFRGRPFGALLALVVLGGILPAAHGQLITRLETEFEGFGPGFGDFTGITGARDVAVSPDGAHVYVIGSLPVEGGSIAVFSRDNDDMSGTFGEVTFIEAYLDDGILTGTIDGLRGPRGVAVSPDGKHVYVAALSDDAIVVFSRDTNDMSVDFGKLTFLEKIVDFLGTPESDPGLDGAHGVTVSADGEHVYIASRAEDAVAVYKRDSNMASGTFGKLTRMEVHFDGDSGVTGLRDPERLILSPDGKHLYVASEDGDASSPGAVAVFARNIEGLSGDFGKLTFVESHIDGVNGADGLLNADDVAVSPDGKHVYVANRQYLDESEDWLAIFSRDDLTGALTFISKLTADEADLCSSLFEPGGVAGEVVISPDGRTVIASNGWKGAVVSFTRNPRSGRLTLVDQECDELGTEGIVTINAVALSPGSEHIYTTGLGPPASLVALALAIDDIEITTEFVDTGQEISDGDTTPTDATDEGTDFGLLDPAGGMVTRTFEIWSDGSAALNLTGASPVSLSGFAGDPQFTVTQPADLVLDPGEMTTFTVTFDPTTNGIHNAMVELANDDPDESPFDFQITGVGGIPEITVVNQANATEISDGDNSPSTVEGTEFGKLLTAGGRVTRTFEIRNDGIVNLTLGNAPNPVTLTGAGASQFSITQPAQLLLTPGQSTTFSVTFRPTIDGTLTAAVNLASDDPDENPYDFQVRGINRAVQLASLDQSIGILQKKIVRLKRRFRKSKRANLKKKIKKLKLKQRKLIALRASL